MSSNLCIDIASTVQNLSLINCYFEGFVRAINISTSYASVLLDSCMFGVQKVLQDNAIIYTPNVCDITLISPYIYLSEEQNAEIYIVKIEHKEKYIYRNNIQIINERINNIPGYNTTVKRTNRVFDNEISDLVMNNLSVKFKEDSEGTNTPFKKVYSLNIDDISTAQEIARIKQGLLVYGHGLYHVKIQIAARDSDSPYLYGRYLDLIIGQNSTSSLVTEISNIDVRNSANLSYSVNNDNGDLVITISDSSVTLTGIHVFVDIDALSPFVDM
jgi:hypothetical protein